MTLLEFEKKYKDKLENIEEWNYLRIQVGFYLKNQNNKLYDTKNKKNNFFNRLSKIILLLKNSFFGFKNWFGKYDYIFISDSSERKLINGYYFDKFFDDIIDKLNNKKNLLIENPIRKHYKNTYTKYIVSLKLLSILTKLIPTLNNKIPQELKKAVNSLNTNISELERKLKNYKKEYVLYKFILKIYSPKIIFINCYYCNLSFVKAAKDLNIKVIEIQHGVISKEHFGYISYLSLDKTFIPDEILVWQKIDYENFLISKQNILGHFYLNYLSNLEINKYEGVNIAVTIQDQDWEFFALIDFIKEMADSYKDISFYLIPRRRNDFPNLPENVKIIKDDCYITLLKCQYHMSIYSSCVIEAGYFNMPSILLDINGYASKYFGEYEEKFVFFIKNQVDFGDLLERNLKINKFNVIDKNYLVNVKSIIDSKKEICDR